MAQLIMETVEAKVGNYMVFFPSYAYCGEVYRRFLELSEGKIRSVIQESGLTEEEKEAFLAEFSEEPAESFAAFCVLGGMFSEGIDLRGDRLIGVIVVGVGLPQLSPEQDVIRDYYDEKNHMGFAYAYQYPGMNKVLQAVGRVIRSGSDRGVALLIDQRFSKPAYRRLFPAHWSHFRRISDAEALRGELLRFWGTDLEKR